MPTTVRRRKFAWITLRHSPPYRSGAFARGLEKIGYTPALRFPRAGEVQASDVIVTWNLNPRYRPAAEEALTSGAALLVAENGYIQRRESAEPFYALARNGHNGSGLWFVDNRIDRWASLGHELRPWRETEGYILIADQRGIGSDVMRCPKSFGEDAKTSISRVFRKRGMAPPPIVYRAHPGRNKEGPPLREHLAGARALVTWASNTANISCLAGIPSFRMAPYHVNSAVLDSLADLVAPKEPDRLAGFRSLAWAQWSLSEIENGDAFRHLLQDIDQCA